MKYVFFKDLSECKTGADSLTENDPDEMRLRKLEWLSNLDEQNRAFYKYDREDAGWDIARRGSTLMALAELLLKHQQDFFLHGESCLVPLKMKEAAASIGVHESTISRAVRDKYLQCPWGLFPLSYFFSAGLGADDREQISARRIKTEIRALVDQEDAAKPLSDQKICDLLQEKGIAVSRRTVAKYREEMGIGSTRERKSWK